LASAVFGAAVVIASLAFGTGLILRSRVALSSVGYSLAFGAYALAPVVATDSVMAIVGADRPAALEAAATAGIVVTVVWFLQLALWPKLLFKGPRG
jgi:hypothetical protein